MKFSERGNKYCRRYTTTTTSVLHYNSVAGVLMITQYIPTKVTLNDDA
jgi:hypothetical protein